jgi:hypothetical protein
MGKAITFGMKWQLNNANYIMRAYNDMRQKGGTMTRGQFCKLVLAATLINTAAFQVVGSAIQADIGDDDERDWADYAAKMGLDQFGQIHWIAPIVAGAVRSLTTENALPTDTLPLIDGGVRAAVDIFRQIQDDSDDNDINKIVADAATIAGHQTFLPIPSVQANRAWNAITAPKMQDEPWYDRIAAAVFGVEYVPKLK